jgi:hypothetical protein
LSGVTVIATEEEAIAALSVNGFTANEVSQLFQMAEVDPEGFKLTVKGFELSKAGPDVTVWQSLGANLDPASNIAAKLLPIISLLMLL